MAKAIIKESQIQARIKQINESLGFTQDCVNNYVVGSYKLDSAYGGHRVVKIVSIGGCVDTIPGMSGFDNKRYLYNKLMYFNPSK